MLFIFKLINDGGVGGVQKKGFLEFDEGTDEGTDEVTDEDGDILRGYENPGDNGIERKLGLTEESEANRLRLLLLTEVGDLDTRDSAKKFLKFKDWPLGQLFRRTISKRQRCRRRFT